MGEVWGELSGVLTGFAPTDMPVGLDFKAGFQEGGSTGKCTPGNTSIYLDGGKDGLQGLEHRQRGHRQIEGPSLVKRLGRKGKNNQEN